MFIKGSNTFNARFLPHLISWVFLLLPQIRNFVMLTQRCFKEGKMAKQKERKICAGTVPWLHYIYI